jgi:hypothetical protein
METVNSLAEKVKSVLKSTGQSFDFNQENMMFYTRYSVDSSLKECSVCLDVRAGKIIITAVPADKMRPLSKEKWILLKCLANDINEILPMGSFQVSQPERIFEFRLGLICPLAEISDLSILCGITIVRDAMESYGGGFADAASSRKTIDEIIEDGIECGFEQSRELHRKLPEEYQKMFVPIQSQFHGNKEKKKKKTGNGSRKKRPAKRRKTAGGEK